MLLTRWNIAYYYAFNFMLSIHLIRYFVLVSVTDGNWSCTHIITTSDCYPFILNSESNEGCKVFQSWCVFSPMKSQKLLRKCSGLYTHTRFLTALVVRKLVFCKLQNLKNYDEKTTKKKKNRKKWVNTVKFLWKTSF